MAGFQSAHDGQNLFESQGVKPSSEKKKDLFGLLEVRDHLVADGLIFNVPVKAFGGLETLVEMFPESDVALDVTIRDRMIEVN